MPYQSVSVDEPSDPEAGRHHHPSDGGRQQRQLFSKSCVALVVIAYITCDWARLRLFSSSTDISSSPVVEVVKVVKEDATTNNASTAGTTALPPSASSSINDVPLPALPTGVNLASWLSLEDWFFVGTNGAVEVASPDDAIAAACLPPLHLDASTGPRWNSETDLFAGLADKYKKDMESDDDEGSTLGGYPNDKADSLGEWGKAVRAIHAHRSSYFDFDPELQQMSELGIKYVRVPVSWCWTDHDPSKMVTKDEDGGWVYMEDKEVLEKYACKDPFYDGVYWPAIPKSLGQRFLRACAKHGIGATLDIHTYPGGTSIGTFSGVWPRYSRFWTHGDVPQPDYGRNLLKDFIGWLESLADSDPAAFKGFRALSPMNEPAHLAGLYNGEDPIRTDRETFLPPLDSDVAQKYLSELNDGLEPQLTKVPDGQHLRVFLWLRDAIDSFRQSKLPSLGKELHVNVHESVFPSDVVPKQAVKSDYGLNTGSMQLFGAWWRASTSAEERSKWAVIDIHHYHAWGPECSGAVEGPPSGRYACSDQETKAEVLGQCATWSQVYRDTLESECGEGLRLASAEFSASTHHSVRHGCNDVSTLKMMLEEQVSVAKAADVELFWWSFKMPYGGAFRNAWSLKHLLYLTGVLPQPDESPFHCGDHTPPLGEPKDGTI